MQILSLEKPEQTNHFFMRWERRDIQKITKIWVHSSDRYSLPFTPLPENVQNLLQGITKHLNTAHTLRIFRQLSDSKNECAPGVGEGEQGSRSLVRAQDKVFLLQGNAHL